MTAPSVATPSVQALLAAAGARLAAVSDSPRSDAELLLAHALGRPRSFLRAWPGQAVPPAQAEHFAALLARRGAGEPVAYLLGRREFWSLELAVSPATLIPRPETERLVELALACLPADRPGRIADLGTGSGAIALALAHERPQAQVVATDASAAALAVARANAERLGLAHVDFRLGDWCIPLAGATFDLIVSNPPYVAAGDPHLAQGDVRFEPHTALVAGADGLDALRRIVAAARAHLVAGGWLLLEHGWDQGEAVPALLRAAGYVEVSDHRDDAGQPRVSRGRWPGTAGAG